MINIIVAMTRKKVIGKGNRLPWHIPQEIKKFQGLTLGKTVIMGRKTYESIGAPLTGRKNIVISKTILSIPGVDTCKNISEAIRQAQKYSDKIFIIGGASMYVRTLARANYLYISWIHKNYSGDVFFPNIDWSNWLLKRRQRYKEFTFEVYQRRISVPQPL